MASRRARRSHALALSAVALVACSRCGGSVAELLEKNGTVERNEVESTAWGDAPVGQQFSIGEAVRTGASSTALLRVGARGGVRMQPNTVLRFLRDRPERAPDVRLEAGEVELESPDAMDLETAVGRVTLEAGGRMRVRGTDGGSRVEVIAGRVQFEEGGVVRNAEPGDAIVLSVGRVVFEDGDDPTFASTRVGAPPDPAPPDPAPPDPAPPDPIPSGEDPPPLDPEPEIADPSTAPAEPGVETSPARAHVTIQAGETATIHDPGEPPTAVRISFGEACAGRGVVTLTGGRRPTRWGGRGAAIVSINPGRTRYAIRCDAGGQVPGGSISLRRDDGSTRLDAVPPRNVVDADGRTYDVLYQNALPILTVRWRDAGAGALQLHVASGSRERTVPASGGRVELGSGDLGEGTHRVWFTAGARSSPETTVRIRFDNAAPAASIREPAGGTVAGGTAHVSGVVLPGFSVRASGAEIPIDAQERFAGDVPVPADADALAIRFSHPRHGVHYYLRRVVR
jgi:hypothetical protein